MSNLERNVVSMRRRPTNRIARSARGLALLGILTLSGLLPAGAAAASPATVASAADAAPLPAIQPTIQYEEAVAHADDHIAFVAGGRVSVPFTPRASDRWSVGGLRPQALPSGRTSGAAMRLDPAGAGADRAPVDLPTVAPGDIVGAVSTPDPLVASSRFEPTAAVDPGALRREVFGFLPYWELTDGSTRLQWDKLSTVAYFGVGADGTGKLQTKNSDGSPTVGWSGWTSSTMTSVIDAAHQSHARVVLTVQSFAWSSTGLARQKALLGSATARSTLAHQIAKAISDRGADGVNLDFEPIASGYSDEFTALVRKVRAVLDATHPGYQLTFDTTGWIGNYPIEDATAAGGADAVFVMGYDYRSSSTATVGSIAPIGGPTYDVGDTLRAYLARVPASRIILGVPYYGRAWSTSSATLGAKNISGTKYGASASVTYETARQFGIDHGRHYDAVEGVSWTAYQRQNCTTTYGCVTPWRQLYYDDATALKAKYDLVNADGLRGIGIWALGYDGTRPELYQAIEDKFVTDTIPPKISASSLTAALISPNGDGHLETTTARLTVTGLITWGYTVQRVTGTTLGGPVRSGQQTGRTPLLTWDGTDDAGDVVADGTYRITLWTADISNNRAAKAFTVIVDATPAAVTPVLPPGYLSPDGDGHQDTLRLAWTATEPLTGRARLSDRTGRTVASWVITAKTSWHTTWSGRGLDGAVVPDGLYRWRIDGLDRAGNRTIVDRPVLVDRTIKSVLWTHASFAPATQGTSRLLITLRRPATLAVGIYRGTTWIRTIWSAQAAKAGTITWNWDGLDGHGRLVPPGSYQVIVAATSAYGQTRLGRGVTVATR